MNTRDEMAGESVFAVCDAFFVAMAVTIMIGLGFASILTLIVVPVLYVIIFRVPNPKKKSATA